MHQALSLNKRSFSLLALVFALGITSCVPARKVEELKEKYEKCETERKALIDRHGRRVPIAIKISPDLDKDDVHFVADAAARHEMDAIIATNTTVSRTGVEGLQHAEQAGGLSGAPLRERSTRTVEWLNESLAGRMPIIAAGGILSAADAVEKITAGASLIQIYTGLIYRGPQLISECARALRHSAEDTG